MSECGPNCGDCFRVEHVTHDLGTRHEDGALYSATCHDCNATWRRRTLDSEAAS